MRRLLLSSLRSHLRRFVASCLAIVLGVAFGTVALTARSSAAHEVDTSIAAPYGGTDAVVFSSENTLTAANLATIRALPSVRAAAPISTAYLAVTWPGDKRPSYMPVRPPSGEPSLPSTASLAEGREPRTTTEIAVPDRLAARHGLTPGSTLTASTADGHRIALTMTGTLHTQGSFGLNPMLASAAAGRAWSPDSGYDELRVSARGGVTPDALVAHVSKALGKGYRVMTAAAVIERQVAQYTHGIDVLGGVFGLFAVVALFVAGLVIANTFAIVLAQRARELALLRCVGASRPQVFGSVLAEAALVGLVASAIGVATGVLVTAAGLALARRFGSNIPAVGVHPDLLALLAPFVIGTVTTVLAAVVPARRATRVAPLAALRPVADTGVASRAGVARLAIGALLLAGGGALLVAGTRSHAIEFGAAGGFVSFLGVLALGTALVPVVIRLLGAVPARFAGPPARLAVANAVRNPRRTSAATSALLVGVTLIVMTCTGIASAQRTFDTAMDLRYPVDLIVRGDGPLPAGTAAKVAAVRGVTTTTEVRGGTARVRGEEVPVLGVDPAAARTVVRTGRIDGLAPGTAIVEPRLFGRLAPAGVLTLTSGGRTVRLRAVAVDHLEPVVLAMSDLRALVPAAPVTAVWVDAADGADASDVTYDVGQAAGVEPDGGLAERDGYTQAFRVLLLVALGLLAVSVLIALVGVGNTLSLSVIERTRENALLRALGLSRGRLRVLLAAESLLMATVALVLGTGLGVLYGWAGTATVMGGEALELVYAVPAAQLAAVAAAAVLAGLLASVLPARRAVRVAPAAALAGE
jgi:putative ABC transport system permease protein